MDRSTVTRTFSIGAICNGTKSSDDVSTTRRHSSAGIRALLWAASSAKTLGCSPGSDFQTSRENIFSNILTPDSIPQFTIPSLSVQSSLRSLDREMEKEEEESEEGLGSSGTEPASSSSASSSTSSSVLSLVLSDRRAERSVSDPYARRRSLLQREVSYPCSHPEAQHCLDPASRAALSLPHLTKVTTPYGFVTLSQSPQMASEEVLFYQAGLRRLNKDEDSTGCLSKRPVTRTAVNTSQSSHLSVDKKKLSRDSGDSQSKGTSVKGEIKSPFASNNSTILSSSPAAHPDAKHKQRFYEIIKKHFTSRHKQ